MIIMIKRELSRFLIVGCITVSIDFMVYCCLINLFLSDIGFAKAIGFISGCVFAYFANRFWTFKRRSARSASLLRFILVYGVGLLANVFINQSILSFWDNTSALYTAFLIATGISATLNFMGMKWFVFTQRTFKSNI